MVAAIVGDHYEFTVTMQIRSTYVPPAAPAATDETAETTSEEGGAE
jgi:hypothetical protein